MNTLSNNHGGVGDSSVLASLLSAMAQNPNDLVAKLGLSVEANNVDSKNSSALRDVALQAFMNTLATFANARAPYNTCNTRTHSTTGNSSIRSLAASHSNTTCDPTLSLLANDDLTSASSNNASVSSASSFPFQTPNATNFMLNDFDTQLVSNSNDDLMLGMMNDRWSASISTPSSASSSTYSPDSVHPQATPSTTTQLDEDVVVVVDEPSLLPASSLSLSASTAVNSNGASLTNSNGQLTFTTLPSLSNATHLSHSTQVQHQPHPQMLPASFVPSSCSGKVPAVCASAPTTLLAPTQTSVSAAPAAPLLDDDFIVEIVTPSSSSPPSSVPVVKSENANSQHAAAGNSKRKRQSAGRRSKANTNTSANNASVSTPTSSPSPDAEPSSSLSGSNPPSSVASVGASATAATSTPSVSTFPSLPVTSLMQQQQLQQQQLTLLSTMMAVTQEKTSTNANHSKTASRCVSAETVDSFVTDASLTSSASSVHALSVFSSFDNLFSIASRQPHQPAQTVSSPSSSSSQRHSDEDDDDAGDADDDEVDEEDEDAGEDDESDTHSVSTTGSRFSFKSRRGSAADVSTSTSTRENKKRMRLARKAELARVSRAKKKQRLDELEQHVLALQNELEQLKREERVAAAAATVATRRQRQDKVQLTTTTTTGGVEDDAVGRVLARVDPSLSGQRIEEAVEQLASAAVTTSSMSSPEAMSNLIVTLNERHQQHLEIGDDLLQRLQQHLKPILPLEFLQWIMSQPPRFYDAVDQTSKSNGGSASAASLWWSLFRDELQCDGAQMKELSALRTTVAKQVKCVNECERAWRRFSEVCREGVWASEMEQMVQLQRVMDPAQFARFCAWVTRYGHLCVDFQQHVTVNSTTNTAAPSA